MQKDFFHIPGKYSADVKVYTAKTAVELMGFQIWQKPKGASLVYMIAVAGGGGGGGGFSRVAGNPGGGGGGGGCSGISRFECPALFLPDVLYIQVGCGGQGGAAGAAGGSGINSHVLLNKSATLPNLIISGTSSTVPGGGGAGTAGAAGNGGTAGAVYVGSGPGIVWGKFSGTAGIIGTAGGVQTGAVGVNASIWASLCLSQGAGGAGCTIADFAGGNLGNTGAILDLGNQGYYVSSASSVAVGGAAGGTTNGGPGPSRLTPFINAGGAGGGSNNSGQAGHGGAGGYGCGGGGGGAGTTAGVGGNGGSGLVIIIAI